MTLAGSRSLYQIEYPASGSPELAQQVVSLLAPEPIYLDEQSRPRYMEILLRMYPVADIP